MILSTDKPTLAALIRSYAPKLNALPGYDTEMERVMWAIAGKESSYGANFEPRHEQGYCYGGRYLDRLNTSKWGCLWHCSYGPWQIMAANSVPGIGPDSLLNSLDSCAAATVAKMNQIMRAQNPQTLMALAMAWNAGHWDTSCASDPYALDVQNNFTNGEQMPS